MSFPEQDRAVQILEKEFGPRWKQIVQELGTKELRQRVGKELTSFYGFPGTRQRREQQVAWKLLAGGRAGDSPLCA